MERQNSSAQTEWDANAIDPDDAPRAVQEYLDVLDDKAFGAATAVKPKFTSHSDPASQWTAARKGPAIFSYSNNYLIDMDNAVIVGVEATRSIRTAEVGASTNEPPSTSGGTIRLHPKPTTPKLIKSRRLSQQNKPIFFSLLRYSQSPLH